MLVFANVDEEQGKDAPNLSDDWPGYKRDTERSGGTTANVPLPLKMLWSHASNQPPRPAWLEPGRALNMLDFDYCFQPIAAAGLVFFGSPAADTVRALKVDNGELVWSFITGDRFVLRRTSPVTNWFPGPANTYSADVRLPGSLDALAAGDALAGNPLPLGVLVGVWSEPPIGVVGLNVGSLASYGRPLQHVHFYDKNARLKDLLLPAQEQPRPFHYLHDAQHTVDKIGKLVKKTGTPRSLLWF